MTIEHFAALFIWALLLFFLWRYRNIKMNKKDEEVLVAMILVLLALFMSVTAHLLPSRHETKMIEATQNLTEAIERNNTLLEQMQSGSGGS